MNLHHHHSNSTPLKHGFYGDHDDGDVMSDEGVPDILVTTPNNREINRVRVALCVFLSVFFKEIKTWVFCGWLLYCISVLK